MAKVVDEITFRFYSSEDLPESGRKVLAYLKGGELVSGATTSKRYFFTGGDSENEVLYCIERLNDRLVQVEETLASMSE